MLTQPNGTLGPSVIKHLVAAGYSVTALTRDPSKVETLPGVKVVQADYSSADALAPALKGFDAVVDLLNRNAWEASILVADAAVAAGVEFLVPSAFGLDMRHEYLRSIPPIEGKVKLEDHVAAKGADGQISYAMIETSMFLDWVLHAGALLPLQGGTAPVFGSGDIPISMTLLDDIGKAVTAAIAKRSDPAVKNKVLFIQSTTSSQNQLLQFARDADPEKKWDAMNIDPDELIKKSWEAFHEGKRDPQTMRGFIAGGSYGKGFGLFKDVDNNLLGITEITQQELGKVVAAYVNGGAEAKYPYCRDS